MSRHLSILILLNLIQTAAIFLIERIPVKDEQNIITGFIVINSTVNEIIL